MGKASRERKEKHELRELAGYRTLFDDFKKETIDGQFSDDWVLIDANNIFDYIESNVNPYNRGPIENDPRQHPKTWLNYISCAKLPFRNIAFYLDENSYLHHIDGISPGPFVIALSDVENRAADINVYDEGLRGPHGLRYHQPIANDTVNYFWENSEFYKEDAAGWWNIFWSGTDFNNRASQYLAHATFTALMTLQFLNMRNVELIDGPPPPPRIQQLHEKHYGEPLYTYKVLSVGQPRKEYTEDADYEHGTHAAPRGHIVRGHPRRVEGHPFIPDGVYWIPAHTRGDFTKGEVFKDYRIVTPDEEQD